MEESMLSDVKKYHCEIEDYLKKINEYREKMTDLLVDDIQKKRYFSPKDVPLELDFFHSSFHGQEISKDKWIGMLLYFHLELKIIEIVFLKELIPGLVMYAPPAKIKILPAFDEFCATRENESLGMMGKLEMSLYYEGETLWEKILYGKHMTPYAVKEAKGKQGATNRAIIKLLVSNPNREYGKEEITKCLDISLEYDRLDTIIQKAFSSSPRIYSQYFKCNSGFAMCKSPIHFKMKNDKK